MGTVGRANERRAGLVGTGSVGWGNRARYATKQYIFGLARAHAPAPGMETVQVPKAATQAKSLTTAKAQVTAKNPVSKAAALAKPAIKAAPTKPVKEIKIVAPFANGDFVVYPAHGVGKVTSIETQLIGGQKVEL